MKIGPDFERIRKTVRHMEPDRVPLLEALVDYSIQSRFLGKEVLPEDVQAQVLFWSQAGYDYIPLTLGMMKPGKVTQESKISKVIREVMLTDSPDAEKEDSWNLELTSFIKTRADFDRFPWEAASELDFDVFVKAENILPDGMKVIALSGKIFTLTWMMMGFNHFALSLIMDEDLVADVFKQIAAIQFKGLEKILSMPHVGAVWVVDDLAFGTGPMISPQAYRDHVFPWYREMARRCHEKGRLFFMHSDGNLMSLMEDIIDIGVDLLQPIDPTCMDIVKVKRQFGDRISLAGNVSNELLRTGTPTEVEKRVKTLIQTVAPGGGYCLGSGNSVPDWAKFENYMTMREVVLTQGSYPIKTA
jgi:uroporphyrinogen decarboxylase